MYSAGKWQQTVRGNMTTFSRRFILLGGASTLAACAAQPVSRFLAYDGPQVTGVVVYKQSKTLHLLNGEQSLLDVPFELGFAPNGHKQVEGDGRTPEGQYWVDKRNPNSAYHLSVGISYPNEADRAFARELNQSPGGDIFLPGTPEQYVGARDWTAGCIAVPNREIEFIYAMVKDGTPIWIVGNENSALVPTDQPNPAASGTVTITEAEPNTAEIATGI